MDKNTYEVYQDFNTKDWIVYDNYTNRNVCHCDTEEEARDFIKTNKDTL